MNPTLHFTTQTTAERCYSLGTIIVQLMGQMHFFPLYDLLLIYSYALMTRRHLDSRRRLFSKRALASTFWLKHLINSHIHLSDANGLFVLLLFSGLNGLYEHTFLLQCKKGSCLMALSHEAHIIKTDKPYQVTRGKERSDVLPDTIPPALTLHPSLFRSGIKV